MSKLYYTSILMLGLVLIAFGIALKDKNTPNKPICNHLKANKSLMWMDSILNSEDTIIRYFDNGSRLEFYPNPYNKLKTNKK